MAKGCMQRPGYDYMETFSPVVRMDTLCAILALVPMQDLNQQGLSIYDDQGICSDPGLTRGLHVCMYYI